MKVTINDDNTVDAEVCYTHYGHQVELWHARITKGWRRGTAAKIQKGVSKEKILDDIRDDIGSSFFRHHLVDNADLNNIKRSFSLDEIQRHINDQQSVLSWIKEWETSGSNPILYYKLQGEENTDASIPLQKDDFMIVVQAEAQKNNWQRTVYAVILLMGPQDMISY